MTAMAKKSTGRRAVAAKPARSRRQRAAVTEILYNRVTGKSQKVTVLPSHRAADPRRMTFSVHVHQRDRLRDLCSEIHRKTGARVSSSMIIRGMLDALANAKLELSDCRSEADVRTVVESRLSGKRSRRQA